MCSDCFRQGYFGFETESEFAAFRVQLLQKLDSRLLLVLPAGNENHLPKQADALYQCQACGVVWALSCPDNAWRGYFLPLAQTASYLKDLKRKSRVKSIGCLMTLGLALAIFLWNNFR